MPKSFAEYNLALRVFIRWSKQSINAGTAGLAPRYPKAEPEKKALEMENARPKKIIANQALELEFKTELLKKQTPSARESNCGAGIQRQKCIHHKTLGMGESC